MSPHCHNCQRTLLCVTGGLTNKFMSIHEVILASTTKRIKNINEDTLIYVSADSLVTNN
jgi:hypothetical protein